MRRVLLIKPPERSHFNFGAFSLAVLAAAVRDLAQIEILDATEMTIPTAVGAVWSRRPEVIGVTTMGVTSVGPTAAFVRALRGDPQALTGVPIVVGGHGAYGLPEVLLRAGADLVVRGEGEITFRRLLQEGMAREVPGTACLVDGQVVIAPPAPLVRPLDNLAPPARDLMPRPTDDIHLMETSRGCPHACSFCEATRFHGRHWRAHSPERVVQEVRRLVRAYDAWIIHFCDDNFAASRRRVLRICEALRTETLPAFFMVSARADDLAADPELIPALAAARILRVSVGVETLDDDLAHAAGKPIAAALYRDVFDRVRDHGIFSVASFIVGLPGESRKARRDALDLAIAARSDAARFVPFVPMPGVPMAEGFQGIEPDADDAREAQRLNRAFLATPAVRERLLHAVEAGGIRGILARGVLAKSASE
jgi:anaerobic magnesium-protoporphyrin IX monomethyl ester cyclase